VLENVLLPSMVAGFSGKRTRKRAMELLGSVGLEGHAGNYSAELSGGEMQRAAICRALINDPDLILADEPTGNLDSVNSSHIIEILKELNRAGGKTLIIATHDRNLAENAGKVAVLVDGRLESFEEADGKAESIKREKTNGAQDILKR
jgi:putative ABC transport system ATP-binding protein